MGFEVRIKRRNPCGWRAPGKWAVTVSSALVASRYVTFWILSLQCFQWAGRSPAGHGVLLHEVQLHAWLVGRGGAELHLPEQGPTSLQDNATHSFLPFCCSPCYPSDCWRKHPDGQVSPASLEQWNLSVWQGCSCTAQPCMTCSSPWTLMLVFLKCY